MNKQQLAAKIWESANQMRSKIEANEYKDYILGFIFYKYLSDKLVRFAKDEELTDAELRALAEKDKETVEHFQSNLGYFIAYQHLFSTWIDPKSDFDVSHVRDALSAFNRLIHPNHKRLFDGIFKTLETGLSKLGDTAPKQTKAISDLIHLIKAIRCVTAIKLLRVGNALQNVSVEHAKCLLAFSNGDKEKNQRRWPAIRSSERCVPGGPPSLKLRRAPSFARNFLASVPSEGWWCLLKSARIYFDENP